MTHYKEILRLHNLGINNTRIAESCGCARSTVISTVQRAQEKGITWEDIRSLGEAEVARKLYPATSMGRQYKMPDYEYIHREMQKSGVTLSLCRCSRPRARASMESWKYCLDLAHIEHTVGGAIRAVVRGVLVFRCAVGRPEKSLDQTYAVRHHPAFRDVLFVGAGTRGAVVTWVLLLFSPRTETASPDSRTSHTSISSPPPVPFPQKPPTGGLCTSPWLSLLTRQDAALCRAP